RMAMRSPPGRQWRSTNLWGTARQLHGRIALLVASVPWTGPGDDPAPAVAERLGIDVAAIRGCVLLKRSVDARGRPPRWLANNRVDVGGGGAILARRIRGVRAGSTRDEERQGAEQHRVSLPAGTRLRPIVVGAGPAGLF